MIAPVTDRPSGSNRSISRSAPFSSSPIARTIIASPLMVTSRKWQLGDQLTVCASFIRDGTPDRILLPAPETK